LQQQKGTPPWIVAVAEGDVDSQRSCSSRREHHRGGSNRPLNIVLFWVLKERNGQLKTMVKAIIMSKR